MLQVRNLSKRFDGVVACDTVSLSLEAGSLLSITGRNGSGKTSFLNLLGGELRADDGVIDWEGRRVEQWSVHRRRRGGIGRSYQHPVLFDDWTVEQSVTFAWIVVGKTGDTAACRTTLEICGLSKDSRVRVGDLPVAKKKLLDLALTMAGKPRLLLLDEPCAGVGSDVEVIVRQALLSIHSEWRPIMVIVEHRSKVLDALKTAEGYVGMTMVNGVLKVDEEC